MFVIIRLLDGIYELLAFSDNLVTLLLLEHQLDCLFIFLLLVILAACLELVRELFSQAANQTIGQVLQVPAVGLKDVRSENGADIWLSATLAHLGLFDVVPGVRGYLTDLCLVIVRV